MTDRHDAANSLAENKNMQTISGLSGFLGALFALGFFVADVLVAIGAYRDATARQKAGKQLMILTPGYWSCVCLVTCLAVLALYWMVHYSTFSKISDDDKKG